MKRVVIVLILKFHMKLKFYRQIKIKKLKTSTFSSSAESTGHVDYKKEHLVLCGLKQNWFL